MTLRPPRLLALALAVSALAFPAASVASSTELTTDRGVVQSVGAGQIVLRALDGGVEAFAVSPATRVRLNGVRVTLADIRPGLVANVVHNGSAPATVIRAFGKPANVTDRGVVIALSKVAITVRTAGGATVSVGLDASTRFRLLGVPARRSLARPGAVVAVTHPAEGPAKVVNVLKRAGA